MIRTRQSRPALTKSDKAFLARLRKGLVGCRHSIGAPLSDVARGAQWSASEFAAVEYGRALPSARMLAHWLRRLVTLGRVVDKALSRLILRRFRKIAAVRRAAGRRLTLSTK